jgi:hypothetical protein
MTVGDRTDLKRLILQIERDLTALTHLRTLLTAANATAKRHRHELRAAQACIRRGTALTIEASS